jgi:hypothetical protein
MRHEIAVAIRHVSRGHHKAIASGLSEPFFHFIGDFLGATDHVHIGPASATAGDEFPHGWVLLAGIPHHTIPNGLQPLHAGHFLIAEGLIHALGREIEIQRF